MKLRFSIRNLLWLILVVAVALCICFFIATMDNVCTFDLGSERTILITRDLAYDRTGSVYYEVYQDGKQVVPPTRFSDFDDAAKLSGLFRVDRVSDDIFAVVNTYSGKPEIAHDFKTGASFPFNSKTADAVLKP